MAEGNGNAVALILGQPLDESVTVAQARDPRGNLCVVVQFSGPGGIDAHWLDGHSAQVIGDHLAKLGRATAVGLEAPGGG